MRPKAPQTLIERIEMSKKNLGISVMMAADLWAGPFPLHQWGLCTRNGSHGGIIISNLFIGQRKRSSLLNAGKWNWKKFAIRRTRWMFTVLHPIRRQRLNCHCTDYNVGLVDRRKLFIYFLFIRIDNMRFIDWSAHVLWPYRTKRLAARFQPASPGSLFKALDKK